MLSVTKYRGFVSSLEYFSRQVFSRETGNYRLVQEGQFAYATIHLDEGSVGLLKGVPAGKVSPMYTVFQCNPSQVDREFVFALMKSDQYMRQYPTLGQGSVNRRMSIPFSTLATLPVLLPPLPEQRKIAAILGSVDAAIEKTEALIAKLKDLKTAMMQELLTRGLPPNVAANYGIQKSGRLKDSPIGKIPEEWEVVDCDSVCRSIVVGIVIQPTQYYAPTGIPLLRSANVREWGVDPAEMVYMAPQFDSRLTKSRLSAGDVVTVRTGYPGTSCVIPPFLDGANCIDLIISRPGPNVTSAYLAMWINSDQGRGQVLRSQGGLAQQHFNVGELKRMSIALPSTAEQTAVCSQVGAAEHRLQSGRRRLEKLHSLKKALMQDLLTGRVRVKV